MYELPIKDAVIKTVKGHQYYVFKAPNPHTNQDNRPTVYPKKGLDVYKGAGANPKSPSKLLTTVFTEVNTLMTALLDYGKTINDWSMLSTYVQNGFRPDDASQGHMYLAVIYKTIAKNPTIFKDVKFPENLEDEAQGVLGKRGDPRREAFRQKVAAAPGWSNELMESLFGIVDKHYAPQGFNPHATGLVFDLDFTIWSGGGDNAARVDTDKSPAALQSAVGSVKHVLYAVSF